MQTQAMHVYIFFVFLYLWTCLFALQAQLPEI